MTYALHAFDDAVAIAPRGEHGFTHVERVTMMAGGAAAGAVGGVFLAIAIGQLNLWTVLVMSAGVLALGLHLGNCTLKEAWSRGALGCAAVAIAHMYTLLAWPIISLYAPASASMAFVAPAAGLLTLGLLASCWRGQPRAIYRLSGQAALVAALGSYQGLLLAIGS
jgi:hypothetical protein